MEEIKLLEKQLTRMRGMNRFYHHQFLIDVRIFFVLTLLLFYLSFDNYFSHYLINLTSIFGSVLLAFHAYYLIFSRHYSEFIEKKINNLSGKTVYVTHKLENKYFFPINDKKIVVAKIGKDYSWFSFVTLFITFFGVSFYFYSLYNIYFFIGNKYFTYLSIAILFGTFIIGYWWFVRNTGEERLTEVYKDGFN